MPSYQHAKPFDIIRTILDIQRSVKQLQVRSSGVASGWVSPSLLNGFTLQADGRFQYQIVGSVIWFDVFHMTAPASVTLACANLSGPPTDKQWPVVTSSPSGTSTPRAYWQASTGNILVQSVAASATDISWSLSIPLDV